MRNREPERNELSDEPVPKFEHDGRGVVVCATSDAPALVRLKSAYVATAIAEWFRDQGKRVLLLMDSVTRFAMAQREISLSGS